jgi:hypothetical protein
MDRYCSILRRFMVKNHGEAAVERAERYAEAFRSRGINYIEYEDNSPFEEQVLHFLKRFNDAGFEITQKI